MDDYEFCFTGFLDCHSLFDLYFLIFFTVVVTVIMDRTGGWERERRRKQEFRRELPEGEGKKNKGEERQREKTLKLFDHLPKKKAKRATW